MPIKFSGLAFSMLILQLSMLADATTSTWLGWKDAAGGLVMIDVMVPPPATAGTYYCTLQWNAGREGGGYAGLQRGGGGYNKHVHFSLWNSQSGTAITEVYRNKSSGYEVKFEPFGGEGTGMKCYWVFPWEDGKWYTHVVKTWEQNNKSYFGEWFRDYYSGLWYHVFTMAYPLKGVLLGATSSFLEDFGGGGSREVHEKNGYKLSAGKWIPLLAANWWANGSATNANGGVKNDEFFMATGGNTQNTIGSNTSLKVMQPAEPTLVKQMPSSFKLDVVGGKFKTTWEPNFRHSPPFSFKLEVFDNIEYGGTPVYTKEIMDPAAVSDEGGTAGSVKYYGRLTITDIFEKISVVKTTDALGIVPGYRELGIKAFVASKTLVLQNNDSKIQNMDLSIFNLSGEQVFQKTNILQSHSNFTVPVSNWNPGVYLILLKGKKVLSTLRVTIP